MKVLYAIQGTGNGHLSRAREIIPILQKKDIELDLLVSGIQADITLPYEVKYRFKGLSFIFGKKGGVAVVKTYLKSNLSRLQKEINSLQVENYDLVINDFEPVSAWACKRKNVPCIGFSHQSAVLSTNAPKPKKKDTLGTWILKKYAPSSVHYGLHFENYGNNVFTPVIRKQIRDLKGTPVRNHITVYLPSYSDKKLIKVFSEIKGVEWQVFSKHSKKAYNHENVIISPVNNDLFINSLASSKGVVCGAGFETPAEALFLEKQLLVIPMKGQYEQQCNSAALKKMGVPVLKKIKKKHIPKLKDWVYFNTNVMVDYKDETEVIIDSILSNVPTVV